MKNWRAAVLLFAGVGWTIGCASASSKKSADPLEPAETAVANAEKARAGDYAAENMRDARAKLVAAREAARQAQPGDDKAIDKVRMLGEEAVADAELAVAQSRLARIQAATLSLQQQAGLVSSPLDSPAPSPEAVP